MAGRKSAERELRWREVLKRQADSGLKQVTLSGSLFVFVNRRRDRIKLLYWGQTGFCIWYQQLQQGTYQLPDSDALEQQETIEVTRSQLSLILDGIDLGSIRQRRRFQLPQALLSCDVSTRH